jgi:mono/diheme cytochrome c family protein
MTSRLAPWLLTRCGGCHYDQTRGNYSIGSFLAIQRAGNGNRPTTVAGQPEASRLYQVIESGQMPRGGQPVPPEEQALLRRWIDQGMPFDGPSPLANLSDYASATTPGPSPPRQPPSARGGTGGASQERNEASSSELLDRVAPLLVEHCSGCHLQQQPPRGGLAMDTINQLLRGGNSGPAIVSGAADRSLLIRKLRGQEGQRMPLGRPPLSDEQIDAIAAWIDGGAAVGGLAADQPLPQLIQQQRLAGLDHDQLQAERRQQAEQLWRSVVPKQSPQLASSGELIVLSHPMALPAEQLLGSAEKALAEVRRQLRIGGSQPAIKGGLAIIAFHRRYEYAELGRMSETRTLPESWSGHWRLEGTQAYTALIVEASSQPAERHRQLVQHLGALVAAGRDRFPAWLAEGVGRELARSVAPRHDPQISLWETAWPDALRRVREPRTLIEGRASDEDAGLLGALVARQMLARSTRKPYAQLQSLTGQGVPFETAFEQTFGPLEVVLRRSLPW